MARFVWLGGLQTSDEENDPVAMMHFYMQDRNGSGGNQKFSQLDEHHADQRNITPVHWIKKMSAAQVGSVIARIFDKPGST
jgi:hypothetical protein